MYYSYLLLVSAVIFFSTSLILSLCRLLDTFFFVLLVFSSVVSRSAFHFRFDENRYRRLFRVTIQSTKKLCAANTIVNDMPLNRNDSIVLQRTIFNLVVLCFYGDAFEKCKTFARN